MESDESLGYHWGSWLGDGIQPLDGLTDGDEANSLEPSLLLSLAGESAASSPSVEQANSHYITQCSISLTSKMFCWLHGNIFLTQKTFSDLQSYIQHKG